MKIWIIDHYSVPVKYYPLARNTNFAKFLAEKGHDVRIIAASTVHNSDINLVDNGKLYKEVKEDGVLYTLIRCKQYFGNGISRILNMMEFSLKLPKVASKLEIPDAIISTSMTLFACKKGLQLSKKYKCKKIAQITDLWPESVVEYGIASKHHPFVLVMRHIEKWIYTKADTIIFSMEGAYDYIHEQKWEKKVPQDKVRYINNGVDLEQFNYNKNNFIIDDQDLRDKSCFNVVYTGSIRKVNNIGKLLDVAKLLESYSIRFLIWGDGDELDLLKERLKKEQIKNVIFKGRVSKEYIPYIVSAADLNLMHGESTPILRFGLSANKLFDYFAAGKPILCDFTCKYNPMVKMKCGIQVKSAEINEIADKIIYMSNLSKDKKDFFSKNAKKAAEEYSFNSLANKLLEIIYDSYDKI